MHANEAKRAPEIGNLVSEEDDPDYLSETDFADKLGKHKVKQKGRRQGGTHRLLSLVTESQAYKD